MENTPPTLPQNAPKKDKKGCLIGCLVAVVIAAVLVIAIGFAAYPFINKLFQVWRVTPVVQELIVSWVADEKVRIVVTSESFEELGKKVVAGSPITPAVVSNIVERIIAERAAEKQGKADDDTTNDDDDASDDDVE